MPLNALGKKELAEAAAGRLDVSMSATKVSPDQPI